MLPNLLGNIRWVLRGLRFHYVVRKGLTLRVNRIHAAILKSRFSEKPFVQRHQLWMICPTLQEVQRHDRRFNLKALPTHGTGYGGCMGEVSRSGLYLASSTLPWAWGRMGVHPEKGCGASSNVPVSIFFWPVHFSADLVSMNEIFVRAQTIFDHMMKESLARHALSSIILSC